MMSGNSCEKLFAVGVTLAAITIAIEPVMAAPARTRKTE
jgi:hypothetical protein